MGPVETFCLRGRVGSSPRTGGRDEWLAVMERRQVDGWT